MQSRVYHCVDRGVERQSPAFPYFFQRREIPQVSISLRSATLCNELIILSHLAHHALALWSLGATGAQIRAASDKDSEIQQPIYESPEQITESNFTVHVGDRKQVVTRLLITDSIPYVTL